MLVAGETEIYESHVTLTRLGEFLEDHLGMTYTLITTDTREDIPGMEQIADADLAVLAIRRRALAYESMLAFQEYLEAGKPILAFRTTSHAFDPTGDYQHLPDITEVDPGELDPGDPVAWRSFDNDVLGCDYDGYPSGATAVRMPAGAMDHPIMEGLEGPYALRETMYRSAPLGETTELLLMGACIDGGLDNPRYHRDQDEEVPDEPLAWTNDYNGAPIFYTSMGGLPAWDADWYQRMMLNALFWLLDEPAPDNLKARLEEF